MSAFGIPDNGDQSIVEMFRITAEQRAEAWEIAVEQACTLDGVAALEARLHKRLELLRNRDASADVERAALAALGHRRMEILAGNHASPASASGSRPE